MNRLTFSQEPYDEISDAKQPNYYFARLMSPEHVAEATTRQPTNVQRLTAGHWCLSGDVSAPMFELLCRASAKGFPVRITCFTSPEGFGYMAVTHQVESYQHRLVLALTDPAVHRLLKSVASTGKLTFLLGNNEGIDSMLLPNPLLPEAFIPALAMTPLEPVEVQRAALKELACVLTVMGRPLQVPSLLPEHSVKHVSVSLLLPDLLTETYDSVLRAVTQK